MKRLLSLWLPVAAWAGVIFYLSSVPHLSTGWGVWDLILRKMAHMVEFGVLALLFWRALSGSKPLERVTLARWTLAVVALYALSDEFHQSFVPGRVMSLWDVSIDTLGGYIAILFRSKILS